jgi:hypothetical protein
MTLAAIGACCALAACGSSASSATNSGSASSSADESAGNGTQAAKGARGGRFTALRSCLAKQGINLPAPSGKRRQGAGPGGGGLLGGGGVGGRRFQPPAGVSATKFQEALKSCGAGNLRGAARFNSPTAKAAFTNFAACMRENGVSLPAPNTSGNGPVFSTRGLNTASAQFRSAQAKCQSILLAARAQGGQAPGAPPGG